MYTHDELLKKVCIKSANAYFVQIFCIEWAYFLHTIEVFQTGLRQTVFWSNKNVIHININSFP